MRGVFAARRYLMGSLIHLGGMIQAERPVVIEMLGIVFRSKEHLLTSLFLQMCCIARFLAVNLFVSYPFLYFIAVKKIYYLLIYYFWRRWFIIFFIHSNILPILLQFVIFRFHSAIAATHYYNCDSNPYYNSSENEHICILKKFICDAAFLLIASIECMIEYYAFITL